MTRARLQVSQQSAGGWRRPRKGTQARRALLERCKQGAALAAERRGPPAACGSRAHVRAALAAAEVVEAGTFMHPCEGEVVCKLTNTMVRGGGGGGGGGAGNSVARGWRPGWVRNAPCRAEGLPDACARGASVANAVRPAAALLTSSLPAPGAARRSRTSTRPSSWRTRPKWARWRRSWGRSTTWCVCGLWVIDATAQQLHSWLGVRAAQRCV